jgi:ribosome-binding factor A
MTRKHTSAPSQRQLRVGEALRHALAEIFARGELRDPALADVKATVTEVRVSPDLKAATAFVVPFGGGDAVALAKSLNNAAGFFRMRLAAAVDLRVAPVVRFQPDQSFDQVMRIERILKSPAVARDLNQGKDKDKDDGDGA